MTYRILFQISQSVGAWNCRGQSAAISDRLRLRTTVARATDPSHAAADGSTDATAAPTAAPTPTTTGTVASVVLHAHTAAAAKLQLGQELLRHLQQGSVQQVLPANAHAQNARHR